jgi:hypothetical protein
MFLTGCAFSPVDRPSIEKYKPKVIVAAFPRMLKSDGMDISAAALRSVGYEVGASTPELGEVKSTARNVMVPQLCDCGSWNGTQITGTAESMISITVEDHGTESAVLKINHVCATNFKGQNLFGATTRNETYQCASTGSMENQLLDNFRKIKSERGK